MEDILVLIERCYALSKRKEYTAFYKFYNVSTGKYVYVDKKEVNFKYISLGKILNIYTYHSSEPYFSKFFSIMHKSNFYLLKELLDTIYEYFKDYKTYEKVIRHLNYLRGNRLKFEGELTHDDLMYFVKRLGNDKTYTLD